MLLYPYACSPPTGDGFAVQQTVDGTGMVPNGDGTLTAALTAAGAAIAPGTLVISFYGPDGLYLNSWV